MFKVNNKDTNSEHICSCVSIVNFEHVNAGWVWLKYVIVAIIQLVRTIFSKKLTFYTPWYTQVRLRTKEVKNKTFSKIFDAY